MIIKRKYVRLKKLYMTDEKSKKAIDEAYASPPAGQEKQYKESFRSNSRTTFFNIPFGWWVSIPNVEKLSEDLEKLDKTAPYDNGKTYKDVYHAEVLGWCEDGTVILLLTDRKGNAICVSECEADPDAEERIMRKGFDQNINMYPD